MNDKLFKRIPIGSALFASIPGAELGAGLGLLARGKFEDRFKEEKDKTLKDKFLENAPLILGAAGALGGAMRGHHVGKKIVGDLSILAKHASLKKEVKLHEHQLEAIDRARENDGSLLIAHATGTGKTLTGIATFEKLKEEGKAKRAVVVVPASLRSNFIDNGIKKFTNSSVSTYGPVGEKGSKKVGDTSHAAYNVISYDLFREHGDRILEDTGADTLIMDEVHKARATEGSTYNKLRELRGKVKNAITLTGSVVNNEPNDVVPLLDITYTPTGHKLVNKDFFDKLFVKKETATSGGFLNAQTVINKKLMNKPQLSKYLVNKIDFISHKDMEKNLPKRKLEIVEVPMSSEQKLLYDFSLSSVDPITRWKIRNNIPVGQKEAQAAFAQLLQARQISTDPAIMSKELALNPDPATHSPKIKKVVEDLKAHLDDSPDNKSVIFGNLLEGQLKSVAKSLKHNGIPYATFFGVGNEGNSSKKREESIKDFQKGSKRVLLISGAGAEGLDLKNANMMQVLEGHYNPERIQQAESRVRRMGAPVDEVTIRRYVSIPSTAKPGSFSFGFRKSAIGGDKGVDNWVYSIAEKKDKLNTEFRDLLKDQTKEASAYDDAEERFEDFGAGFVGNTYGSTIGNMIGAIASIPIANRNTQAIETAIKQRLLDKGHENLTTKKHYKGIMAESKMDERSIDVTKGVALTTAGLTGLAAFSPGISRAVAKKAKQIFSKISPSLVQKVENKVKGNPFVGPFVVAAAAAAAAQPIAEVGKKYLMLGALGGDRDLDIGIQRYVEKARKKAHRKYKSSKGYVQQFEVKKDLGIDTID